MFKPKTFRILTLTAASVAALAVLATATFFGRFPVTSEPRSLDTPITPALEARGRYLAEHVTLCTDCHSARDPSRYSMPVIPGTHGQGGMEFGAELGIPGKLYAPNITPAALGDWTDGEILRALTEGVSRDGRALFPLMPYKAFATLCEEDAAALVRYVRTLQPVENEVPRSRLDFPLNLIVRTMPAPAQLSKSCEEPASEVERGRRLVALAGCAECHSPTEMGRPVEGLLLAGGVEFRLPGGGVVRSANLTPDPVTGIGAWTREMFISRFKGAGRPEEARPVEAGQANTIMPWTQFSGMTAADLGATYDFLRTVPKVERPVLRFESSVAGARTQPETELAER